MVELVWDHKYDKPGIKTAPVSVALPFQTIETLNESSQQRQKSIESFLSGRGKTEWRNRLIWGDKKYVLPSLLPEFANSIDLIYIDPHTQGHQRSPTTQTHSRDMKGTGLQGPVVGCVKSAFGGLECQKTIG